MLKTRRTHLGTHVTVSSPAGSKDLVGIQARLEAPEGESWVSPGGWLEGSFTLAI